MDIQRLIKEFAFETGIIAGVCDAKPLENVRGPIFKEPPQAPLLGYKLEQRRVPEGLLKGAKSIIVIGAGYNRELKFEPDNLPRGRISMSALGLDYHIMLRRYLKELEDRMVKAGYVFKSKISVDTGPLSEKVLAVKAGLGWIGKHGLCISDKFGSFFNIGYMLTTLHIDPWHDLNLTGNKGVEPGMFCDNCDMCVKACPGEALGDGPVRFDYTRCVSYLTQRDGELTPSQRKSMGTMLYGCDICQKICPMNLNTYVGKVTSQDYISPTIDSIMALDEQAFNNKYKGTAIHWRGLENLQRNAMVALENFKARPFI